MKLKIKEMERVMKEKLNSEEIFCVCKAFIKGRGYACILNIDKEIQNYLVKNNYIYSQKEGYYFLEPEFYKDYKKVIDNLNLNKFEKELIKEYCALHIVYFDAEIMHLFLNNPKFHFVWSGYRGYVCSTEDSMLDVYIKDLCLCHDLEENKIIIGAFLVDLIDCSEQSQQILQPYMLEQDDRYEFHEYNYKNLFEGQWLDIDELDIYTVILSGIKIVNYIFTKKYGFKLYKNEYDVEELQFFLPLFYPTKVNRFNFMMELSKIFLDNINGKGLKKLIQEQYEDMSNKNEFTLEELKKEEFREFKTFKTYFSKYSEFNSLLFKKLDEIRMLRTEPAHKIYTNDLNYMYSKEQDETLVNMYRVICSIINVEDPEYKILNTYENGEYNCFYGKKGAIYTSNGFNAKKYKYYNGYIRLINDKFKVRDSEILIAGNDIEVIRKILFDHMKSNFKNIEKKDIDMLLEILFSNDITKANEKELKSFFYGQAYIKRFHGECKNYKKEGKKLYKQFLKLNYKYVFVIADSTDLYWNLQKTLEIIKKDNNTLFGSGILMYLLSNNFAEDKSNIFNHNDKDLLIINNVWD